MFTCVLKVNCVFLFVFLLFSFNLYFCKVSVENRIGYQNSIITTKTFMNYHFLLNVSVGGKSG